MKSMTGYGRGESARHGLKITVEVSSVNRKQTEAAVNLPRDLEVLEAQIRDAINRRVSRGRVTVRVTVQSAPGVGGKTRLDSALARSYARDLRRLARDLGLREGVTLDLLARLPGVVQPAQDIAEAEELWPATAAALNAALDMMLQMRAREGAFLARDLKKRMDQMRRGVARVQRLVPRAVQHYRAQLLQRIQDAGIPFRVPPPHLLPERLGGVLAVLYLLFNEGYSASAGSDLVRLGLTTEALRLARIVAQLMPDEPEVQALLALMLFQDSRRLARVDAHGDLVTLEEQDRALWDRAQISEAQRILSWTPTTLLTGPYQLQAGIAACHAAA